MVALAQQISPANQEFRVVRTDDCEPSPLNYRKVFRGIEELGASLKAKGQRVPIKVRPNPAAKLDDTAKPWQLVYGERRWRGAKHAGVEELLAIVQDMTDAEVIEEQLVENASREDVHPYEEAQLFKRMIDDHGYDRQTIADKIGKSLSHVHARLKLNDLKGGVAIVAFGEEKVSASIALLIARIPDAKSQDKATREVLEGNHADKELVHGEWIEVQRPMSYREAQVHIQQNYMLRLDNAPFPVDDAGLVKAAGSCVGCLYRTGNQPDLFGDVKSADVCTNPPCFAKKKEAQFDRDLKTFKAQGGKVLPKKQTDEIFDEGGATGRSVLRWNSEYSRADEKAPWEIDRKQRTWAELFGAEDKVPVVLAKAPDGTSWRLVNAVAAKMALEKAGVLKEPKKASGSRSKTSSGSKAREPSEAALIEQRTNKKLLAAIVDTIEPKAAKGDATFWRWLAAWVVQMSTLGEGFGPLRDVAGAKSESPTDLEKRLLAAAKTPEQLRRLVISAVAAEPLGMSGVAGVRDLCKLFKVDWEEVASDAKEEVKAELADKQAKPARAANAANAPKPAAKKPAAKKPAAKKKGGSK